MLERGKAMEDFGITELKLNKTVKKGDKESLLSLFDVDDRFKPIEVLVNAVEESPVKVMLEGLGEAELLLGADMDKGQKKTIMTLFWFNERNKPIEMTRNAEAGEHVTMHLLKV
jgi:hypothetical protein